MPKYVTLVNFTDQGIRSIRELPDRWDAARKSIETAGGSIETADGSIEYCLTMGQHDAVVITDFPSTEVGAAAALSIGSHANARTETLNAFTEEETRQIISSMPGG